MTPIGTPHLGPFLNPLLWKLHFITRAPHARLFPRCSVVVHHGGAGSSCLTWPTSSSGATGSGFEGSEASPCRGRLTAAALASRLRATIDDANMRGKSEEAGVAIRAETGPARAAELIEAAIVAHRSAK